MTTSGSKPDISLRNNMHSTTHVHIGNASGVCVVGHYTIRCTRKPQDKDIQFVVRTQMLERNE